jgi:F-type H+-transporting ATPase subunit a
MLDGMEIKDVRDGRDSDRLPVNRLKEAGPGADEQQAASSSEKAGTWQEHDGADHDHDSHKQDAGHKAGEHDGREGGKWSIEQALAFHLDTDHLIAHVQDSTHFEWFGFDGEGHKKKIEIPKILPLDRPVLGDNGLIPIKTNDFIGNATFQPTKFLVLELVAALIVCAIFIPYARRIRNGDQPKGRFWNMIDAMVLFVRDQVAVPSIGSHDARRFLPFVWTIFFFILTLNLLGMIPGLGAATGSISVTAAFALAVFFLVIGTGVAKMGLLNFLKAQAPHLDIHPAMKIVLLPAIWMIEMFGLLIKHAVLAVRLFANMFAGHLVVGVFVAFIGVVWGQGWIAWGVTPMAILASVAINLLELLVVFIQAYVFAFLTSLFIGTAIHPH